MATQVTAHMPTAALEPGSLGQLWWAEGGRRLLLTAVLPLLAVAAVAWSLVVRASDGDVMTAGGFVGAWAVMMVAMMLPAVAPVVGLYALAARRGVVAAVPYFVMGYLLVWSATGIPAYAMSRWVSEPLMDGKPWVARLTGGALLVAAGYQLTPLKATCLRRCRSPLSFFLTRSRSLSRPRAALAAGASHGVYCLGCCWAVMGVLAVLGGMQLGWALALAVVISLEKLAPWGLTVSRVTAAASAVLGVALLAEPSLLVHLIRM